MRNIYAFIFCMLLATFVKAEEKITKFDVELALNKDASAVVTENITVTAEHNMIKRGIYRVLPQSRKNLVKVIDLHMDGSPHPYFNENKINQLRINFGNDDFIAKGSHSYCLRYSIENIVRFFKDYDEVYWNVTGNQWAFAIDKAKFTLIAPYEIEIIKDKISFYTGRYGSKESYAKQTGNLTFETTKPLFYQEGFSVAVPFKKGIIKQKYLYKSDIIFMIFTSLIFAYYFIVWRYVGKDPQSKIIRQYQPPQGISAAFSKYLSDMSAEGCMAVVFISLALKGIIKITQETESFFQKPYIIRFNKEPEENMLSMEETAVYNNLIKFKKMIRLSGYDEDVEKANKKLKENLRFQENGLYFHKNLFWHVIPSVSIAGLLFYLIVTGDIYTAFISGFVLFFCIFSGIFFASKKITKKTVSAVIGFTAVLIFIFTREQFYFMQNIALFCTIAVLCGIIIVFSRLLPSYTAKGRLVMDEIDGFKQYLSIAEKGRTFLSDPTNAQQIYCDYLPYAIALGVENKWTEYFEDALGRAIVERSLRSRGLMVQSGMMSAYIGGFSSAMNKASVKPSKTGSGGGGFSGGGFGGGGGGGR